jgi:uracil-xanthine permease
MNLSWRETRAGVVRPDERLPWGQTIAMGFQHVLAMFGSTVVAPIIMGFDPNLAILFSGIGTLIFFTIVGGAVPSYLGSSFAFIGPVLAITGAAAATGAANGIPLALGGIVAAGVVYAIIGLIVMLTGAGWIDALMPPLVTGAVVAVIGLNLAPAARNLAGADPLIAALTILAIFAIGLLTPGIFSRLPILLGSVIGYLAALLLGGTSTAGRQVFGVTIHGVDVAPIANAAWFGTPSFVAPDFNAGAMALIAPVAIVLVAENTGHIKAVTALTGQNLMPYLGRAFLGDGIATIIAGLRGGTGVTTYAENIGVMAVTRVYSTLVFVVAAIFAIIFGLSPKFGAVVASIPQGVLGGVSTVLFGLIAVTGARIWVDNRVDFTKATNLFVAAVTLIIGAADYTVLLGQFTLNGITLGTFAAIVLYQVFKGAPEQEDFAIVGDDAEARTELRAGAGESGERRSS